MSFPDKEQRTKCWAARDRYWECLDANRENPKACDEVRKLYEKGCPAQWVKHFDRRRDYLQFKERIEKHGYEPLDEK